MERIDLKKELKHLYNPSAKEVSIVDVPAMNFLMIDGRGDPNTSPSYAEAVEALYALAYGLKFKVRNGSGIDYTVLPLEGLWWEDDMTQFSTINKERWQWTMLIAQPEYVTAEMFAETLREAAKKKGSQALERVRFERFHEGRCAQIMHVGPYAAEDPTIAKLHAFIAANGYVRREKHHEIYLKDPRKSAPEKLQTVVRQPVEETARQSSE